MSAPKRPAVARWLARILAPSRVREFVVGDLEELYAERVARLGVRAARRRYWRDVVSLLQWRLRAPIGRSEAVGGGPARPRLLDGPGWEPDRPGGIVLEGGNLARQFVRDLSGAFRSMGRDPAFHAVAVLTLAIGIGATAAVFGMANQLLFRPLPGTTHSGDAAYLQFRSISQAATRQGMGISLPDLRILEREATSLSGLASYGWLQLQVSVGEGRPVSVSGGSAYGDLFGVLGVRPAAGRLLAPEDTRLGGDPLVAVITQPLRRQFFATDEEAVGRTLRVNGHPVTIMGVAGGEFTTPERGIEPELWVPIGALVPMLGFTPDRLTSRQSVMHSDFVVRLRDGVTRDAAEAQIAGILRRIAEEQPESAEWLSDLRPEIIPGLTVRPLVRERTFRTLRLLGGIVLLVLLIACANAANLLLFRNVTRRGAVATRRALGASSSRIARQRLVESLVLAAFGSALGLGVAWLVSLAFRNQTLAGLPAFTGFAVDWRVLGFAAGATVATAILAGAVPAALAGRFDLAAALKEAGTRDTVRVARVRWLMSTVQVALSLTLLVGALLLTRTVRNLYEVDTGLSRENVAALSVKGDSLGGPEHRVERQSLLAAVEAVPGVEGAALDIGPAATSMMGRIGLPGTSRDEGHQAMAWPVTPGWFDLLRVRMLHGEPFRDSDAGQAREGGRNEVVLTASLARRLFGTTNAVGRTVSAGFFSMEDAMVVGVTHEIRSDHAPDEPQDAFFLPFSAFPSIPMLTILARTRHLDAAILRDIRGAVETALPDVAVPDATPVLDRVDQIHSEDRLFSQLLGLLSLLAVLLAAVGLYGVIAFTAARRVREFGIRMVLGAERARIGALVVRDAAGIVIVGTAVGLVGAWLLSALFESRLFGVDRLDTASYAVAVCVFALIAGLASWAPARAATRVDPVETLKAQ